MECILFQQQMQRDENREEQFKKIKNHIDWNLIFLPLKKLTKKHEILYLTMSLIMMVIWYQFVAFYSEIVCRTFKKWFLFTEFVFTDIFSQKSLEWVRFCGKYFSHIFVMAQTWCIIHHNIEKLAKNVTKHYERRNHQALVHLLHKMFVLRSTNEH